MSVKKIIVGGVEHSIDYNALENLPVVPPCPKKINIINFAVDESKDDGRPAKAAAYADGKIDSIEIFRYACPEQIDIDSTVDAAGNAVLEPETHLSYYKDGRQIYARDGDFGYPEIDGTGQFNFRPVFNKSYKNGYVIIPTVTDAEGNVHDGDAYSFYNKFKTPWDTGIDGLYRFTKVSTDINVSFDAVLESEMEANTVTFNIVAPADYDGGIPAVSIFRCSDQAEKYYKYYLHEGSYKTLTPAVMTPTALVFTKQVTEPEEEQVWTATCKSYDDTTGYPSLDGKLTFLMDDSLLTEGYTASASKSGAAKNLNAGDFGSTKVLTKITGDAVVTIRIAPPVSVTYDDDGYVEMDTTDPSKVAYGFDAEKTPDSVAQGSPFVFTIIHSAYGYDSARDPETNAKLKDEDGNDIIVKPNGEVAGKEDALRYIASITVGGEAVDKDTAISKVVYSKKKANYTFNGELIIGDVVITLASRPEADLPPVAEEPVGE